MKYGHIDEVEPRHGDWGPAYLVQDPSSDMGVLVLRPGDAMTNHIHEHCDESFYVIEGTATLWIDCKDSYELRPGDLYRCPPREMHYFVNTGTERFRLLFVKSPQSPGDTINLPWEPGQPAPELPSH